MNNGNAQGRGAPDRRAGSTRAGGKALILFKTDDAERAQKLLG